MTIDPTSRAGEAIEKFSRLEFSNLFAGIFIVGMVILIGTMIYFLVSSRKKPPCPKSTCQSNDVNRFKKPNDPLRRTYFRCCMCNNEWASGPTIAVNE